MKKTLIILLSVFLITGLFVSCKPEPEPEPVPEPEVSVFSVSAEKKVEFTKGNLYWDGDSFEFEANQYSSKNTWDANHVSHFFWSKTPSVSYAQTYNDPEKALGDVFFTNATETTAKSDFTVNGETGIYRTLSDAEWTYLLETRTVNGGTKEDKSYQRATINSDTTGVYGLILYPDNYTAQTAATSYTSTEWAAMETAGCVFLPVTGNRGNGGIFNLGDGIYWTSSYFNKTLANYKCFDETDLGFEGWVQNFTSGCSVRLVKDVPAQE